MCQKQIVEMAAVAGERRTVVAETAQHGEGRVEKRNSGEDDRKKRQRICGSPGAARVERKKSERESKNGAARIAQEDFCRRKIKCKISERSAEQAPSDSSAQMAQHSRGQRNISDSDNGCSAGG